MSLPRFFLADLLASVPQVRQSSDKQHEPERRSPPSVQMKINASAELDSDESKHASKVLRLQPADELEVFDGNGYVARAKIDDSSGKRTRIKIESIDFNPNDSPIPVKLAVAFPKGDRQRSVVEHAIGLGAREIVFLKTARSVAEPNAKSVERLRRFALESAKQCGRNRLPKISAAKDFQQFLSDESTTQHRWFVHPYLSTQQQGMNQTSPDWLRQQIAEPIESVTIAIGPEGGFTDEEVELARQSNWSLKQLGPRILRVETAVAQSLSFVAQLVQPSEFYTPRTGVKST